MRKSAESRGQLAKELTTMQLFSLAFGCIIGVGWVVVLGKWLAQAGPLGAILAFACGSLAIMVIGLCYAEMSTMLPVSGAEVAYAYDVFGIKASFAMGWFLALAQIIVTSFEAISAGWIMGAIFPGIKGPTLYMSREYPVNLGGLLIALGGMIFLTWLNYRGAKSAAVFQEIFTYGLLLLSLIFFLAGIIGGKVSNLEPLFSGMSSRSWLRGFLAVLVTTPFFLAGFNIIPQVMEEKSPGTSLRKAGRVILLAIGVAGIFYCLVIFSASMATPWKSIVKMELPAAEAFEAAFKSPLMAKIVLLAGVCGIVTTWNVAFMSASRILFALGRGRIIQPSFGKVHLVFGSPFVAVLFVGTVATIAIFLGRSAILPIVNTAGICYSLGFLITCLGVIKLRRIRPHQSRPYRVPGGIFTAVLGALFSLFMIFLSLYEPYGAAKGAFPLEWLFFLIWILLGGLFWLVAKKIRLGASEQKRRELILGSHNPTE